MPYVNGVYQSADQRSPMERLYGFEELMAKRKALQQQQAMQQQREQILRESYQPAQEAQSIAGPVQSAEDVDAALSRMYGVGATPGMKPAELPAAMEQVEAKPASFDSQGAIARLYGGNDLEGASALINDQYKDSMANRAVGGEKWSKTGRMVRGEDGKMYSQIQSDAGNSKLVPIDGDLVGQNQVIRAGGKTYIKDAYTGETREIINSTMTPGEVADNDPELQARIAGAREGAKEKASTDAKADIGAEKGIPVVDKTLGIVDELSRHPGREWATGGSSWTSAIPGTPAYDFGVKLEQLTGQTFLNEVEKMRGLGTLTETEGRKLSVAAAALNAAQSEPEFLRQLEIFRGELESARGRYQQRLDGGRAPAASRPARAPAAQAMPSLPSPTQHKGRIVRDTKSGIRYQSNGSQWMRVK